MNSASGSDTDSLNQILRQEMFAERNRRSLKQNALWLRHFILPASFKAAVVADIWQI